MQGRRGSQEKAKNVDRNIDVPGPLHQPREEPEFDPESFEPNSVFGPYLPSFATLSRSKPRDSYEQ
jgi:hypothetical protein